MSSEGTTLKRRTLPPVSFSETGAEVRVDAGEVGGGVARLELGADQVDRVALHRHFALAQLRPSVFVLGGVGRCAGCAGRSGPAGPSQGSRGTGAAASRSPGPGRRAKYPRLLVRFRRLGRIVLREGGSSASEPRAPTGPTQAEDGRSWGGGRGPTRPIPFQEGRAEMMTLINVCGASFSGTTMLDLMLGNAPDAASCGEVGAWFRPQEARPGRTELPLRGRALPAMGAVRGGARGPVPPRGDGSLGRPYLSDSTKRLSWVVNTNRWAAAGRPPGGQPRDLEGPGHARLFALEAGDADRGGPPPVRPLPRAAARPQAPLRRGPLRRPRPVARANIWPRSAGWPTSPTSPAGSGSGPGRHHNLFGNEGTREQVGQGRGRDPPPGAVPGRIPAGTWRTSRRAGATTPDGAGSSTP